MLYEVITAITIAAGGVLTACQPRTVVPDEVVEPAGGANTAGTQAPIAQSELIPQAYLNPQDYDYRQNTTDFSTLFSPLTIGSLTLNHRMIKSAAGSATFLAGFVITSYSIHYTKLYEYPCWQHQCYQHC